MVGPCGALLPAALGRDISPLSRQCRQRQQQTTAAAATEAAVAAAAAAAAAAALLEAAQAVAAAAEALAAAAAALMAPAQQQRCKRRRRTSRPKPSELRMARRRRSASLSLERYDGSSRLLKHVWLVGRRLESGPSRCGRGRGAERQGAGVRPTHMCRGFSRPRARKLALQQAAHKRPPHSGNCAGAARPARLWAHLDDAAQVAQPADGRAVRAGEELEEELALLPRQLAHHLPQPLHHAVLCGRRWGRAGKHMRRLTAAWQL